MLTKKAAKKKAAPAAAVPYVLKDNYLQVTVDGKPFSLDSTHPTFARMKKALLSKNWKAVPKLVTLAQNMVSASQGNIKIVNGVVYYKGTPVDSSLTQRIVEMIEGKKNVTHMLLFMDNLYKNPDQKAIAEFYDWLRDNDLPITDDGHFLAYKSVDMNLMDEHTHTISNKPGQVIMMPRDVADTNWRTQCSSGFHVCSKQYGLYGKRVMAVKVNPADVVAANQGKIRCVKYEVLRELGTKSESLFKQEGFSDMEKTMVVEIKAERKELMKMILESPIIKRLLRQGKLSKATIQKSAYARLKAMAQRYEVVPVEKQVTAAVEAGVPYLEAARKASGLTVGEVAKQMGVNYKVVGVLEKEMEPNRSKSDAFLTAIGALKGIRDLSRSAISYPVPTRA